MNIKNNSNDKTTILIVEDSTTQLEKLSFLLEKKHYIVKTASNGKEGLEAARKHTPSIVISDILMPEMNGYELCRAIRSDENLKETPVVLLTSLSGPADVVEALKSGADNFIRKPYDEKHLLLRIENILTNRKLRSSSNVKVGVELYLEGSKHFITSDRQQILDLLISTYEQAVELCGSLKIREQQLDRANNILSGIYNIAKGLNKSVTEKEVLEGVLERALELPDVKAGWIFIRSTDSKFKLAAKKGLPEELNMVETLEGYCHCQRKVLSGEIEKSANILECERLLPTKNNKLGLRSHVTLPLHLGNEVLGIMNLVGTEDILFSENDLRVLNGIGNQIGTALERCRMHEHLEELVQERTTALTAEIEERKKIEYERERLIAILEATPDLVGLADINGNVIYTNPSGWKMLGFEHPETVKHWSFTESHPEWAAKIIEKEGIPTALLNGSWVGETALLTQNGREVSVSQVIIAHKNSEGKCEYFSTIIRDITEQKRAEKEITMLAHSLRSVNECVSITDMEDKILFVNESFLKTYGYDENKLVGKHIKIVRSPSNPPELVKEILPATIRGGWRGELWNKRKDGSEFPIYLSTTIINDKDNKPFGLIGVAKDITERKLAEEELIKAKEKAEEMNRVKSIFFANMSHELRTPFVAIMGYAELLSVELNDRDDKEMAESILNSSKRMMDTLNKILNLSKFEIDNFELDISEYNLRELLINIIKDLEGAAIKKDIKLELDINLEDDLVEIDDGLFKEIIRNLVSNAINYTNEGKVRITADKKNKVDKELLIIKVTDTGIGIPEDKRELIWEPFRQVSEGSTRKFQGTGLGLAIVKKSTELLGGSFHLESEIGKGSEFTVEIPVKKIEVKKEISDGEPNNSDNIEKIIIEEKSERKRILHVEDDLPTIDVISRVLQRFFEVDSATNGKEALNFIKKNKYDAILMDINLGNGTNGEELTQIIRNMLQYENIPIIAVTAYASKEDKEKFLSKGMSHYISKPFRQNELLELLDEIFTK